MGRPTEEPKETALPEIPDLYGANPRLTDAQVGFLTGRAHGLAVRAGQLPIREGEPCERFFVVHSGSIAITERHGTAGEHVMNVHGPGRLLGELGLLQGQVAFHTAWAREDGEVRSVPVDRSRGLVAGDPILDSFILRAYPARRTALIGSGAGFRILGSRCSPDTLRLREFAARNRLPHRWLQGQVRSCMSLTTGDLPEPGEAITVRQPKVIPFTEIARVAIRRYPRRALLGLALFIGQAFLYNAIVFGLGTILSGFFGTGSGSVPYFMALFAVANFLGPLLLGRFFDTVGRKPMITGTYFGAAAASVLLAVLTSNGSLTAWTFFLLVSVTFFVASAGASSAYLTVGEVFPMETRALSISLFFAVGTAIGGITGPLLFGRFVHSGDSGLVALGFVIGAVAMALGGLAELFFGVRAEQQSLENIARPLTAEEADADARNEPSPAAVRERDLPEDVRRAVRERQQRIADRKARRTQRERAGGLRCRPGTGTGSSTRRGLVGTAGTASRTSAMADQALDDEIEQVSQALAERGPTGREDLERIVGGRAWGPGRFHKALREAARESRAQSLPDDICAPPGRPSAPGEEGGTAANPREDGGDGR
ncbi:MFS transporter [Streptomyces chengbuensis]|uniref:cyclic nucleotide-binding domain-containing protein n=1 Tax=Streptomyces chengbuensis TaxID=3053466 RepID=UPI0025B2E7A6|nr:cyclic nucleotide-binding domain-containing protein [Streptomyces sp. HUAS CB01]WJY48764.1 MFS transporter [Streptomyces sp. HUAS CB01]